MDYFITLLHLSFFGIANLCFVYAVYQRLRIIFKGQAVGRLAPIEERIRSVLFNVIFQFKLFKRPIRGLMHAFIFYGFLSYLIHTTSQMLAGNTWFLLRQEGLDPYNFLITDYIWLGFELSLTEASLVFVALLFSIALSVLAMYSFKIGKHISWRKSPLVQWFFLTILCLETAALALVLVGSGTLFYEAIVQHFSLFVLVGLLYYASRRWIFHAKGLDVPSTQSAIVLILIAVLMLSTLFGSAAQAFLHAISADSSVHSIWIQSTLSSLLGGIGMTDERSALALRNFSWWLHIGTVYIFMIYVPLSKHSHLIFSPINYFLIKKRPWGQMSMMDLEADDAVWGAGNVAELQWKSLLDGLSCIECGRCTLVCPANQTGKLLDPKKIVVDIKHSLLENKNKLLATNNDASGGSVTPLIAEKYISEEELWACTSCHACVEACPVGNNQLDAIMDMRRNLVLSESRFPNELQTAFQNMENQSNPWGMPAESRTDWCSDLDLKTMADNSDVDVLYWVGCAGAFDERNKKIARSFVSILKEAKVNFGILGKEESCTGDSARRGGNEYLYQTMAQKNIETMNSYNVKKIVTACPHCFNTLKNEYPQMGGNYEVQHHSDFIEDLVDNKKIEIDKNKVETMKHRRTSYHDSCYLGRYNEIFEEPRNLVKHALGMDVAEASDHHRNSLCCGAGGAQMWMEEKHEKVNTKRTEQLIDTGADNIATACPFCITMISDGVKAKDLADDIRVFDVAEMVATNMKGSESALPEGYSAKQKDLPH